MKKEKIIFLNGASSSGKTSLAKELQRTLSGPFLHVELDAFIAMLPRLDDDGIFMKMVAGMNRSIAAMSDEGNDLIVDHVLLEPEWLDQCLRLLADKYVLFVGLHCPIEELEKRERARDARRQGFARAQVSKVHAGKIYDLELDTSALTIRECADCVFRFYTESQPSAFRRMAEATGLSGASSLLD